MRATGFFVASIFLILPAALSAQSEAPLQLSNAAHCLMEKDFLEKPIETQRVSYFLDESSYPGKKVLYVATYKTEDRSKGYVFTVFLSSDGDQQVFNIQNNARFKLTKRNGVDFVDPPLGGTWTQEHLSSAIEKMQEKPTFLITTKTLRSDSTIKCESYTDR